MQGKQLIALLAFLASLSLNGILLYYSIQLRFDSSTWLLEDNPHKINKDYLYEEFDRGETLVAALDLEDDFFQPPVLEELSAISDRIQELDHVVEIKNPLRATTIIEAAGQMNILTFEDALQRGLIPNLEAYRKRLRESDYYGSLISVDYRKIAIVIKIDAPIAEDNTLRRETTFKQVGEILAESNIFRQNYYTGEVRLNRDLIKYTRNDLFKLLPIVIFLIFLLLYFVYRNLGEVFITIYMGLTCLNFTCAIFVLRDYPITPVALALLIMIQVITIADVMHILNRWNELSARSQDSDHSNSHILRQTIRQTWLPCLMTSLTTAIGFGSFYFSELIPLSNFGEISAFAILLSLGIILSHTWFVLWSFGERLKNIRNSADLHPQLARILESSQTLSERFRFPIVLFSLAAILAGIFALQFIRTETNFLDVFFKHKSSTYRDFQFVDRNLGGSGAIDIIFRAEESDQFRDVAWLERFSGLSASLRKNPNINHLNSYLNPVSMIHREFTDDGTLLPDNNEKLAQEFLFLEFSRGDSQNDVLTSYLDFDYSSARLHLQTPNLTSLRTEKIEEYILASLANLKNSEGVKYSLTGISIYFQKLGDYVVSSQVISVLATLGFIWLLFILEFGFILSIPGMIANIFPILITTSCIIYLQIPFDFATVLIASVSFGLCIDDTVHFLHFYNYQKREAISFQQRIRKSIRVIGQPIVFTSILFSFGFATFIFSDLVILIKFGLFTFMSLVLALLSNLILLPALLSFIDKPSRTG